MLQIRDERGGGLVGVGAELRVLRVVIRMRVPRLRAGGRVVHGDTAHAVLEQPTREQARAGKWRGAVLIAHSLGFAADVKRVHRLALHLECRLHRADLAVEFRVARALCKVALVQFREEVELFALLAAGDVRIADVGDQFFHRHVGREHARGLVFRGEEAVAPQRGADDDLVARAQHDVAGEILVFGAEAVEQPRAERRPDGLEISRVHREQRRLVVRHIGVHRADDAAVINHAREIRQRLAHLDAALSVL